MRSFPVVISAALVVAGCGHARDSARDALNTTGELAGKAASEVIEGVTTGVEKTWDVEVLLDEALQARGLSMGKTNVIDGNQLSVYLIAAQDIQDSLTAVAVDKDGLEIGRGRVPLSLKAGEADYFDIQFQERTDLKRKSTITIR